MAPRDHHIRRLLDEVASGRGQSQRSLAKRLGIALGLTNLLLRRLVRKGWIRVIHIKRNRVLYLITPAGIAEKARMSLAYLDYTTRYYAEARDRIRERFQILSGGSWPGPDKRVVFCETGDVAEIGYVCLQGTDLTLVAVIGDTPTARFCGMRVEPLEWLREEGRRIEVGSVVVMSFIGAEGTAARLEALGWPRERIFLI